MGAKAHLDRQVVMARRRLMPLRIGLESSGRMGAAIKEGM